MTQAQQLREQRQALNAAINNHDLESAASFLHPDFVAKGTDGHFYDRQAAVRQLEYFLKPSTNFHSEIEVEDVEVSGDSAKLRVRRTEGGRMFQPGHFWPFLVLAALSTAWTVYALVNALNRPPWQYWVGGIAGGGVCIMFIWFAFRWGLRTMHQTQTAQETWRSVDGRWLLAEEQQIGGAPMTCAQTPAALGPTGSAPSGSNSWGTIVGILFWMVIGAWVFNALTGKQPPQQELRITNTGPVPVEIRKLARWSWNEKEMTVQPGQTSYWKFANAEHFQFTPSGQPPPKPGTTPPSSSDPTYRAQMWGANLHQNADGSATVMLRHADRTAEVRVNEAGKIEFEFTDL
jgi:hypothetical protein